MVRNFFKLLKITVSQNICLKNGFYCIYSRFSEDVFPVTKSVKCLD